MRLWPRFLIQKRVYADAAAATPVSPRVARELVRLLALYGNPGGLHAEAVAAKSELERARARVAEAIGAHADEIFFVSGGTEANNLAIQGVLRPLLHVHGELSAVTSAIEHSSVLEPLRMLEREGLTVAELGVSGEGYVNAKDLREALSEEAALVSVQMVNSETGTVQNIREIAKEMRHARNTRVSQGLTLRTKRKVKPCETLPLYFHCDASQAPLWLPINVEKLGVDILTLDAQKMMGPKGAGILYIKRGVELEPLIWGGGQERGLRSGTENVALAGATALALEEAQRGVEARAQRVADVRDTLWREIMAHVPGAVLNGPHGEGRVANNLHVTVPGLNGDMAVLAMSAEGVAVSTRSACDTDDEAPSHVLEAMGVSSAGAKSSLRITLLPDVSLSDVKKIARALRDVTMRYRQQL